MSKKDGDAAVLDTGSPDPLWRQTADLLLHQIATGKLGADGRMPAERGLLTKLAISRATLRRALQSLVEQGVLTASHGRGWYVSADVAKEFPNTLESFSETAARLRLTPSSDVIRAETAPATLDEAEELGVAPGSLLYHLDRVRRLDGVPVAVDISFFADNPRLDLSGTDFRTASLFKVLIGAGYDLAGAETTIEAFAADAKLSHQLDIEPGRPALMMRQLIVDGRGRPILSSVVKYVGDRYRLRTSFLRRPAARS